MKLHDILQKDEISKKFSSPVVFQQFGKNEIDKIAAKDPNILFEIGAQAWMLYMESGAKVDPQKLSNDFDSRSPLLYKKVEKTIKRKVIQDISFSYSIIKDDSINSAGCIQLSLCRMWPNDLYIADVVFYNPYEPVPEEKRKYEIHYFKSLNLFSVHLEKIKVYCKQNKIQRITLTTSSNEQIPYFEKVGFKVENNNFAKHALEMGRSVPMYLTCI
ncbi:hypothetical protein ACTXIM_00635 [Pseudoalteromonas nigrifaciens]|uniref:hypothetical protein n=1 Tax=Pseudoalteromonas nigrifaciens TaxID=28109 RepID=UPI001787929F|nr:hypothetical protein [Pseudoalteromonas nigrifaciens]MBE0419669.1 hypothetical protein [Pseudoalteromonas nigrifaciens]